MGTSASNSGGSGGAWTGFKRSASSFARHGGSERAEKTLAGFVAAMGGTAAVLATSAVGIRTGQTLGQFLAASSKPNGLANGLEAIGFSRLIGEDRYTVLVTLLDEFAGSGSDLERQAARSALLDVLDQVLPEDTEDSLNTTVLDASAVWEYLYRYIAALIYNRAIPLIDERLTRLENPNLAHQRDAELREYIDALVRLNSHGSSPLDVDWQGQQGRTFIEEILQAVYGQVGTWE